MKKHGKERGEVGKGKETAAAALAAASAAAAASAFSIIESVANCFDEFQS